MLRNVQVLWNQFFFFAASVKEIPTLNQTISGSVETTVTTSSPTVTSNSSIPVATTVTGQVISCFIIWRLCYSVRRGMMGRLPEIYRLLAQI